MMTMKTMRMKVKIKKKKMKKETNIMMMKNCLPRVLVLIKIIRKTRMTSPTIATLIRIK